jgi:hypothetical protein
MSDSSVMTRGEQALRSAMKAKRSGLTPEPARRHRRDSTSPWTLDGVQPPASDPTSTIEEPDDSVSTVGWEGPATQSPRSSVPYWAVGLGAAVVLVIAAGGLFLFLKLKNVEDGVNGVAASDVAPAATAPAESTRETTKDEVTIWNVAFPDLPESAEIYVDGMLHPERPVLVPYTAEPRVFRVVAEGHQPWEKVVAVYSDISIDVTLEPVAGTDVGPRPMVKKPPAASALQAPRIDTDYPTTGDPERIDKVYPGQE